MDGDEDTIMDNSALLEKALEFTIDQQVYINRLERLIRANTKAFMDIEKNYKHPQYHVNTAASMAIEAIEGVLK